MTPLTPSLIISRLEHYIPTPIPTPIPAPIPAPSVAPTTPKMFHDKAENFTAIRKNFTASQKNLTASRKCFTAGHYSCLFLGKRLLASPSALVSPLVSPLVRHGFQKQPLIFKQLSARCKRCHLLFSLCYQQAVREGHPRGKGLHRNIPTVRNGHFLAAIEICFTFASLVKKLKPLSLACFTKKLYLCTILKLFENAY